MPRIRPADIVADVRGVLERFDRRYSSVQPFLTAYQILQQLPEQLQHRLIEERGRAGKNSGTYYSAASVVSDAAEMLDDIEINTLNTSGIELHCAGERITSGNANVGVYRLRRKRASR